MDLGRSLVLGSAGKTESMLTSAFISHNLRKFAAVLSVPRLFKPSSPSCVIYTGEEIPRIKAIPAIDESMAGQKRSSLHQ